MIKCNDVKVCAVISRAASEKTGKDGSKFLSFSVKPTITAYNGESKELDINVTFNGDRGRMAELTVGKRVQVAGTLSVNKRNGEVKFYLRAESVEVVSAEDADSIEGEMTFTGKIGKKGTRPSADSRPIKVVTRWSLSGCVSSISVPRRARTSFRHQQPSR